MITVKLYTRKDCHLCEDVHAELDDLRATIPHKLEVIDIDTDPGLIEKHGLAIPVVEVGPYTLRAPITRQELQVTLSAAQGREREIERVENSPRLAEVLDKSAWKRSDTFDLWISNHYMLFFNTLVAIYFGLTFLAPVLAKAGYQRPARWVYGAYSLVCHQLAYRSFYLFGEQIVYPRAAAGVDNLKSFAEATGLSEGNEVADVWAARSFIGNQQVGYKIALCERDLAIYGSILAFGILFSISGRRLKSIPWWLWLLLAILPIGLDGFSQLFSQPPLNFIPYRESTPALRVITGSLFGFFTAWFGYPMVEESMADTRRFKTEKFQRLKQLQRR